MNHVLSTYTNMHNESMTKPNNRWPMNQKVIILMTIFIKKDQNIIKHMALTCADEYVNLFFFFYTIHFKIKFFNILLNNNFL